MFSLITAARNRNQNTAVVDDATGHVHAVKTGKYEKCRSEEMRREREANFRQALRDQMRPFVGLASQENQPTENREPEELLESRHVMLLDRRQREHHRNAADDQQKGHERGQINSKHVFRHRPVSARMTQNPVTNDQTAKGHSVAGEKEPHPQFAPTLGGQGRFLGLYYRVYCSSFTHLPLSFGFQVK